jgi:hypothetical protein
MSSLSFTWLNTSEQQMLDVINPFRDKETWDELGIGTIRDALADLFYPGTSTNWTSLLILTAAGYI